MRHALSIAVVTGIVAVSAGLNARPAVAAPSDMDQPVRVAQNSSGGPNVFSLLQDIQRLQEQVDRQEAIRKAHISMHEGAGKVGG